MCGTVVYRVQGPDGRGPFRPGFSSTWTDADFAPGMVPLPSWIDEFGVGILEGLDAGEYIGCATRAACQLARWFSESERRRLDELGFRVVRLRAARILAESENQLVFANRIPLNCGCEEVPWP